MRYLGLDIGDKRTGLALGDAESGIISPLGVVEQGLGRPAELAKAIAAEIDRQRPNEIVAGIPLNEDGSDSAQAKKVRGFVEGTLRAAVTLPVHLHDERLTTDAAHWAMAGSGLTHGKKKERRDAVAAAEMLRDFFSGRAGGGPPAAPEA